MFRLLCRAPKRRPDPIVHARPTTTEAPKPTEAGEVEYENEGGTTVATPGGGGGRRNQRGRQSQGHYDYHYDREYHWLIGIF